MLLRNFAKTWDLYAKNTSLHGIRYAREQYIPRAGKFIWLTFFLGAMGISVYMAQQVYRKYHNSPVITSLKTVDYKVETENFPAVTVCIVGDNHVNLTPGAAPNLKKWEANSTCVKEVLPKILSLRQTLWTESFTSSFTRSKLHELERSSEVECNMTEGDLHEFLTQTVQVPKPRPSFSWVSHQVTNVWVTKDLPRKLESETVLTNHGTCFTANYQRPVDSVLKISQAGFNTGMEVIRCNNTPSLNGKSQKHHQGNLLVLLHDPYDFPDLFLDKPNVVSLGELASLSFTVTKISATAELAKIALSKRHCLLPTDKPRIELLNLTESLANCHSNCMARSMMQRCGCLPYFYIGLLKRGISYKHCRISSHICLTTVSYEVRSNLSMCDCYPNCNTVRYTPDVWFQAPSGTLKRITNCAEIEVFAKSMRGHEFEVDVRYGWEDLMAAIGGLLGLGVGFSFISLLEFIYFFCCHWWLEYCRRPPRKLSKKPPRNAVRSRRVAMIKVSSLTRY